MNEDSAPDELILLPSLKAQHGPNGGLVLTQKFLNGVAQYAKTWPGRVTTLVRIRDTPTSDMDHVEIMPGRAPHNLEIRPISDAALAQRLQHAAVVLAFLSPNELSTARLCQQLGVPLVYSSEYSLRTEKQIIDAETINLFRRWRRKLWVTLAERKRITELRMAAGIQCSGAPTYEVYRHINPNALLFFDNRVPVTTIISEAELARKVAGLSARRPLRLIFGGRLIAMKGVLELPKVAHELQRRNISFTLDIYGSGALENQLRTEIAALNLQAVVSLKGVLDFETGWIPLLKEHADLFLCCHPQGDPSSTYPEVMSCGVPIVGYDNEAFTGIVKYSGCGWQAAMNQPAKLADIIAHLARHPAEIAAAALKAREFSAAHAFETTFAARVKHLVRLSRLPNNVKDAYGAGNQ